MTRLSGKTGDTGLEWAGFQRGASESLIHACRDDDARCVKTFANEAIDAALLAVEVAKNPRQREASNGLLREARTMLAMAEHPDQM